MCLSESQPPEVRVFLSLSLKSGLARVLMSSFSLLAGGADGSFPRAERGELHSASLLSSLVVGAGFRGADLEGAGLEGAGLEGAGLEAADSEGVGWGELHSAGFSRLLPLIGLAGLHWVGLLLSCSVVGDGLSCPVGGADLEGDGL